MTKNPNKKLYLHPGQMEIFQEPKRFKILVAGRRFGKPLDIDTMIPTPQGLRPLHSITIGDSVYTPEGEPVRVVAETDHFSAPSKLVVLEGGNSVVAGDTHEWVVYVGDTPQTTTVTTLELLSMIEVGEKPSIPNTLPTKGYHFKTPIDPETFGWWLYNPLPFCSHPTYYYSRQDSSLMRKHINSYLRGVEECRRSVLKGLQEASDARFQDRKWHDRHKFFTYDDGVAEIAHELAGSLGLVPSMINHHEEGYEDIFSFYYYKTPPKRVRLLNVFDYSDTTMKCIEVDHPDGLFLCSSAHIVTHNSRLLLTDICTKAMNYKGVYDPASPPVCLLAMPTLKQARAVHWTPLCNLLEGHPLVDKISKTDFRITFKGKRPDIVVRGANDNDGDGLRGMKFYYAGLDEFQDMKRAAWEMVIKPALMDTPNSQALIIGTPKGSGNYFYDLFHRVQLLEDWGTYHKVSADNPFIPKDEIENARQILPEKVFKQEYEACWENFDGQIFTELTPDCLLDPLLIPRVMDSVYIGMDWGDTNPAIVVVGRRGDIYYVLETWQNTTEKPVEQHTHTEAAIALCIKYNVSKGFADPSQPGRILSCRKAGIPKLVAGYNRVIEGNGVINALLHQRRLILSRREEDFYKELQSYHRAEKDGVILNKVAADQKDHRTDALRYVLASLEYKNIFKYKGDSPDRPYNPDSDTLYPDPLVLDDEDESEYA